MNIINNDPYFILGVSRDASDAEIKSAYRRQTLTCHPDRYPDDKDKEAQFRRFMEAYEQIDTLDKRKKMKQSGGLVLSRGVDSAVESLFRQAVLL